MPPIAGGECDESSDLQIQYLTKSFCTFPPVRFEQTWCCVTSIHLSAEEILANLKHTDGDDSGDADDIKSIHLQL